MTTIAQTVAERAEEHWVSERMIRAYDQGRRVFDIKPCGDPYSRAWDVTEFVGHGHVYRGDLGHRFGRNDLRWHLRRSYPNCMIREQR